MFFNIIKINNEIQLDESEISESFSKSSGPGGQHINKVSTKVELRFQAEKSTKLSYAVKERLRKIAGRKWSKDGEIIITAEKYRSQLMNRNLAKEKLISIILEALEPPTYRLKTRPGKAVKMRRANDKVKRSRVKSLRGRVDF
jgi:ribosome-associated protein